MTTDITVQPKLIGLIYFRPTKRLRQYFMLEALARGNEGLTQRDLGKLAGLSPAVVNQYLMEFTREGLVERFPLNRRDLRYQLTSMGEELRRELMVAYIRETFQLFRHGKDELAEILRGYQRRYQLKRVVFYSAGQVTEVLLQALAETSLELLAIVDDDPGKQNMSFFGYPVVAREEIARYRPDAVIITTFRYRKQILEGIQDLEAQGIRVLGF
jgi:DNA-binding MarR family transcriptional regulator